MGHESEEYANKFDLLLRNDFYIVSTKFEEFQSGNLVGIKAF